MTQIVRNGHSFREPSIASTWSMLFPAGMEGPFCSGLNGAGDSKQLTGLHSFCLALSPLVCCGKTGRSENGEGSGERDGQGDALGRLSSVLGNVRDPCPPGEISGDTFRETPQTVDSCWPGGTAPRGAFVVFPGPTTLSARADALSFALALAALRCAGSGAYISRAPRENASSGKSLLAAHVALRRICPAFPISLSQGFRNPRSGRFFVFADRSLSVSTLRVSCFAFSVIVVLRSAAKRRQLFLVRSINVGSLISFRVSTLVL